MLTNQRFTIPLVIIYLYLLPLKYSPSTPPPLVAVLQLRGLLSRGGGAPLVAPCHLDAYPRHPLPACDLHGMDSFCGVGRSGHLGRFPRLPSSPSLPGQQPPSAWCTYTCTRVLQLHRLPHAAQRAAQQLRHLVQDSLRLCSRLVRKCLGGRTCSGCTVRGGSGHA